MANQMQGPRVRNEIKSNLGVDKIYDRKAWSIYDTGSVPAAGITEMELFKQPIGQGTSAIYNLDGIVKTIADTNMKGPTLSKGENMVVYYVSVQIGVANPIDSTGAPPPLDASILSLYDMELLQHGVLEITRANDAIALQQPLWKLPAGGGIGDCVLSFIGAADATQDNLKGLGNGAPFVDARYYLRRNPIVIRAQEAFGVKIRWGALVNPQNAVLKTIQVHLEGEMWKEVY